MQQIYDCIIIGSGVSGLAAAYTLSTQSKLTWLIIQSKSTLGGRIKQISINDRAIDIGAYELPGYNVKKKDLPELYRLIDSGLCKLDFRKQSPSVYYYDQDGRIFNEEQKEQVRRILEEFTTHSNQLIQDNPKISLKQGIESFQHQLRTNFNKQQCKLFKLMLEMEKQEHSGNQEDIALDSFIPCEEIEDSVIDSYPLPIGCYAGVVERLIQLIKKKSKGKGQILTDRKVTKVTRKNDISIVQFQLQNQTSFTISHLKSKSVICSAPLSTLKLKQIIFSPELPLQHQRAINGLGLGYFEKIIIAFEQPFWPSDAQRIKIFNEEKGGFSHFDNLSGLKTGSLEMSYILVGFATSDYVKKLYNTFSDKQIFEKVVSQLKRAFPKKSIKPIHFYLTKWINEPDLNFSFSYIGKNLRFKDAKKIRESINDWLWIVGEHCYPQDIGCAYGAYETGVEAAEQIIQKI